MTAKQVFYTGRVQGVGFRYAAKRLASGFEVTGWVRNLNDGRVEMQVMSRDADELKAFLEDLQENSEVSCHIREVETHPIAPLTGVTGFSILK